MRRRSTAVGSRAFRPRPAPACLPRMEAKSRARPCARDLQNQKGEAPDAKDGTRWRSRTGERSVDRVQRDPLRTHPTSSPLRRTRRRNARRPRRCNADRCGELHPILITRGIPGVVLADRFTGGDQSWSGSRTRDNDVMRRALPTELSSGGKDGSRTRTCGSRNASRRSDRRAPFPRRHETERPRHTPRQRRAHRTAGIASEPEPL